MSLGFFKATGMTGFVCVGGAEGSRKLKVSRLGWLLLLAAVLAGQGGLRQCGSDPVAPGSGAVATGSGL